jgi:5-hydroxyisourate hydrolase-like protein (transthyretin family)
VNERWILRVCGFVGAGFVIALASGCGERPLKDGTQGVLRFNDEPAANIRVTVNRVEPKGVKSVGYGVTDADGSFRLVTHAGRAGLKLSPGDYRCTLKSMGGSVRIPNHYAEVNTTPLKISWSEGDTRLDLHVRASAGQSPAN